MGKTCDVSVSRSDKICRRDEFGFYQTSEYGYSLTAREVPEEDVKKKSLELRLQVTKFLCNSEVMDGKKNPNDALDEIKHLENHLTAWRERNGAE